MISAAEVVANVKRFQKLLRNEPMSYADRLHEIATNDAEVLKVKDAEYGGSWLKRGGIGAFMMAARKWDRLETTMMQGVTKWDKDLLCPGAVVQSGITDKFDIIEGALADRREEGILDDIGDLRRYLLLIEAEIRERMGADRQPDRLDVFSPTSPSGAAYHDPEDPDNPAT